jgi:hypothetical protein
MEGSASTNRSLGAREDRNSRHQEEETLKLEITLGEFTVKCRRAVWEK